jgi:hypothetical protein
LRGKLENATAIVTHVEDTRFTEGGGRHSRGRPIYGYHYKFTTGGADYTGVSYRTGSVAAENEKVTVEFPVGNPGYSRIKGMRRSVCGPIVGMVFIFPAVGLAFVLPGLRQGWRNIHLLAHGEAAQGVLVSKSATNVMVNKKTVYKLTFSFMDRNGQARQAIAKASLPEKLEDNRSELVFYDPIDPAKSTLLDNLPGSQALTERGEFQSCSFGAALRAILGPLAALAVIVGGLLIKLF